MAKLDRLYRSMLSNGLSDEHKARCYDMKPYLDEIVQVCGAMREAEERLQEAQKEYQEAYHELVGAKEGQLRESMYHCIADGVLKHVYDKRKKPNRCIFCGQVDDDDMSI